ncbi:hypothetical protein [Alicyclobacillus dauci]|uniref:DUF5050 domain-containing protein n=1 Tax=Alicyclobacillus dauci TaxID=1475485 RepID=A0ABY6Z3E6_9BACL|nr:hypothetical protein [Alicyclobacillus dauci]WAH36500.1 hypothetical protein NZD86_20190 [Alicyclobacillus dauci]
MAKKIGRKLLAFVGVVTVGQLVLFQHYNALFNTKSDASMLNNSATRQAPKVSQKVQQEIARLQSQQSYKFVTVSPNQDYATYLDDNNVLHIEDLQAGHDVSAAKNPYKVEYVSWIQDQGDSSAKVFVGEQIQPGDLELKTVDVSDGSQAPIAQFTGLASNATISKITFSFDTNDIYILVNTDATSAVYHIGTMKHVTQVPTGGRYIKNIAIAQTGDKLYFEDRVNGSYNVLYFDTQYVAHRVQLNAALVAVVGNTVYYGQIDNNGLVTAVYRMDSGGQSTLVSTLQKPTLAADIDITESGQVQVNSSTA